MKPLGGRGRHKAHVMYIMQAGPRGLSRGALHEALHTYLSEIWRQHAALVIQPAALDPLQQLE